jgi:hypothetical protein
VGADGVAEGGGLSELKAVLDPGAAGMKISGSAKSSRGTTPAMFMGVVAIVEDPDMLSSPPPPPPALLPGGAYGVAMAVGNCGGSAQSCLDDVAGYTSCPVDARIAVPNPVPDATGTENPIGGAYKSPNKESDDVCQELNTRTKYPFFALNERVKLNEGE